MGQLLLLLLLTNYYCLARYFCCESSGSLLFDIKCNAFEFLLNCNV